MKLKSGSHSHMSHRSQTHRLAFHSLMKKGLCDIVLLIVGFVSSAIFYSNACKNPETIYSVLDYGAFSDGITDDSQAFLETWNEACNNTSETENPTVLIPNFEYVVNPVVFCGPCKPKSITFLLLGRILAPDSLEAWDGLTSGQWLAFRGVNGLSIVGPGRFDGRGSRWWAQSCRDHPHLVGCTSLAPTVELKSRTHAIKFLSCNNVSLSDIHFINSSQTHVSVMGCDGIYMNSLTIEAPERSPNTDGIHLQSSHNVIITNIVIRTGDDCISIGDHTSNIHISYIQCGPGHGISIGSLGRGGNFVEVENIFVSKIFLKGTTNGARIKTWQVGRGYVRGVVFKQLYFDSVKNPIIIDQNYCNIKGSCKEERTAVRISNVIFSEFYGTSSTNVAINLNCSRSIACTDILLKAIKLRPSRTGHTLTSSCTNAYGYSIGMVQPRPCFDI